MGNPTKIRSFVVDGQTVDVDASKVNEFLQAAPDAKEVQAFIVDGDTVDVDIAQVNDFLKAAPDAKPAFDNQPQEVAQAPAIPSVPVLSDIDRQSIEKKLSTIPEKFLADPNFQEVFVNKYASQRGVDKQAVRDIFQKQKLQDDVYVMQQNYRNTGDPQYLAKAIELHQRLGQKDLAQQAQDLLFGKLTPEPTITRNGATGQMQGMQPDPNMVFLDKSQTPLDSKGKPLPAGDYPMGSETRASQTMSGVADAMEEMNFLASPAKMVEHGIEKIKRGANTKVYGITDAMLAEFDMLVGAGETAMGAMGVTPAGGVFFAGFDAITKLTPPDYQKVYSPFSSITAEKYQKAGIPLPAWKENVMAIADFALLGAIMGGGAKSAEGIAYLREKNYAKAVSKIMMDLTPEQFKEVNRMVTDHYQEYKNDPQGYRERILELAADADKELAKKQAEQPYTPEQQPETLKELMTAGSSTKSGKEVVMGDKKGFITRDDKGFWYFGEGKDKTILPVQDVFNPTETLKDLGLEVEPKVKPQDAAKVIADASESGTVSFNGNEYVVAIGDNGEFVFQKTPEGELLNILDTRTKEDAQFKEQRKQEILQEYRNQNPPEAVETPVAEVVPEPVAEAVVPETPVAEPEVPQTAIEVAQPQVEVAPAKEPISLEGISRQELEGHIKDGTVEEAIADGQVDILDFMEAVDRNELPLPEWLQKMDDVFAEEMGSRTPEQDARLLELINRAAERKGLELVEEKALPQAEDEQKLLTPKEDAVQESPANEGVLRQEGPEVGLQEVGKGNPEPKEAAGKSGEQPKPTEKEVKAKEKKERVEARKKEQAELKRAREMPPNSLRHWFLQFITNPKNALKTSELMHYRGFGAKDAPPFSVRENGTSIHSLWESAMGEYEAGNVSFKVPESDHEFADKIFGFMSDYSKRSDYKPALLEEAKSEIKAVNEREQQFLDWYSEELQKYGLELKDVDPLRDAEEVLQELHDKHLAEIEHMSDEQVYQLLEDLDNNAPKSVEELNKIYEEYGIEEQKPDAGTSENQIGGEAGSVEPKAEAQKPKSEKVIAAEEALAAAKDALAKKRSELNKALLADNPDLFGEREAAKGVMFDERADAAMVEKALEPYQQKVEAAKLALEEAKNEKPVKEPSGDLFEEPKPKTGKEISDAAKWLADKIREGKVNRPDAFLSSSPAAAAWDLALEAAAKTTEVSGDAAQFIANAIANAIEAIRETDWYKGLSKDQQEYTDNAIREHFSDEKPKRNTVPPVPDEVVGIRKAYLKEENAKLGLPDGVTVTEALKRDWEQVQENAAKSTTTANRIIADIQGSPRPASAEEHSILLNEKVRLTNMMRGLSREIYDGYKNGMAKDSIGELQDQYDINLAQMRAVNETLAISGYETSISLNIRKMFKNLDYTMAGIEEKWRGVSKGREMPEEIRKKFESLERAIQEENDRYEALVKKRQEMEAEQAFKDIQEAAGRKKTLSKGKTLSAEKKARKAELRKKLFGGQVNDVTEIIRKLLTDKEMYEYMYLVAEEAAYDLVNFAKALKADIPDITEKSAKEILDAVTEKANAEERAKKMPKVEYDDAGNPVIKIPHELLYDLVEEGVKDANELTQKVFDMIKDEYPEIEFRQVKDAISGYGKKINPPKDEVLKKLNRLKVDAKLESGLEDAEAGIGVKRSGFQRPKPTDYQREIRRKINDELSKYPEDAADVAQKWATALDKVKSQLKNSIADLEKRIDNVKKGIPNEVRVRRQTALDSEASALKDYRDKLREELQDLEGKKGLTDEQRLRAAMQGVERSKNEYARRLKEINDTGTYTTGTRAPVSDPALDAVKAERDKVKAEYEQAVEDNNLKAAEKKRVQMRALDARIRSLENKIFNKDVEYKDRANNTQSTDPDIVRRREHIKALNEVISDMRDQLGIAEKRRRELYMKRINKRIADLENRLRTGDYAKKPKAEIPLDNEIINAQAQMERLRYEMDKEIEKERLRNRSSIERWKEIVLDAAAAPKSILASMDLSAILRQGGILSVRDPQIAAKAMREMFKQMASKEAQEQWLAELHTAEDYGMMKKTKLYLSEPTIHMTAKEDLFGSDLAKRVPLVGETLDVNGVKVPGIDLMGKTERAYTGYLNKLRVDTWRKYYDAAKQRGLQGEELLKTMNAFSEFINNATGRANLGKLEASAKVLNASFFAPRFVISRFNLLLGNYINPKWWRETPKTVKMERLRALSTYIAVGATTLQLAKSIYGAQVEDDMRSTDFGKIRIGDTRIDIWAGFQQWVRLMAQVTSNQVKDSKGKIVQLGEGYKANTRGDLLLRFARTKLAPVPAAFANKMVGQDLSGDPFSVSNEVKRMVVPLIMQDMKEMVDKDGYEALKFMPLAILGAGVQSYEQKPPPLVQEGNVRKDAYDTMIAKDYNPKKQNLKKIAIMDEQTGDYEPREVTPEENIKFSQKTNQIAGEIINEYQDKYYTTDDPNWLPLMDKEGNEIKTPLKDLPPVLYKKAMANIMEYARFTARNEMFGNWMPASDDDVYEDPEVKDLLSRMRADPRR